MYDTPPADSDTGAHTGLSHDLPPGAYGTPIPSN